MSKNFQRPSEERRPPHKRKIPVLHVSRRRRARQEQEKKLAQQSEANEQSSPPSVESEPQNASTQSANSSLNPNAQEFVFTPATGLNASAPEFVMNSSQPPMLYPMPIQQPIMMVMPMSHIQIPNAMHHPVYAAEDVEEAQRMVNITTPPDTASSTASTSSPAPKLETIEEESELDEEDKHAVFFGGRLDFDGGDDADDAAAAADDDDDDCKEREEEDADDPNNVQSTNVCRDDETGQVMDGVVRQYRLDELISYRSLSICQASPAVETLLVESFSSTVPMPNRSSMDAAFQLMAAQTLPPHLLNRAKNGQRRIVGKMNDSRIRNNVRSCPFPPRHHHHQQQRYPPPRRPVRLLSDLSQRKRLLSAVPQTELDDLMKKCRSILNKITPENSERLTSRLSELVESRVKCYEHLEVVLSAIVNVGIVQTAFVKNYVQILKEMAGKTEELVQSWDWIAQCDEEIDSDKIVKIIVRNCCRKNHELYWHTCSSTRQTDFLHSFVTTELGGNLRCCPRELSSLMIEYCADEDSMTKVKKKFLGLEVLLGHLYKQKMVPAKLILRGVINPLLRVCETGNETEESWRGLSVSPTAEELEAVCKLMTVVGFELDAKAHNWMDTYFGVIESASSKLESRIKFMVMDLKDLRAANWGRPREQNSKPKHSESKRRPHFEDVSRGFRGNVSSHNGGYHRRNAGRGYRTPKKFVRRSY